MHYDLFNKAKKAGLLATGSDCYILDVNMQSPLYNEYVDCERKEMNEIDCGDFASFEKLLDRLFESCMCFAYREWN